MLLLGVKNVGTQTVLTDGIISVGSVYRKFCKMNECGVTAFSKTSQDVSLNHKGIYHITANLVGSGDVAGVVTVQLLVNGVAVDGAFSSETITTADTELRTFTIDYYVKVDKTCSLGVSSTDAQTISLQNTGVDATFTSVILNIDKVV
jgi:hypothetical protein